MSPQTIAHLQMIRRASRPVVGANRTKRPIGGRVNPCAVHREHSHPLAEIARVNAGSPHRRRQQLREVLTPGWQRFSDGVVAGDIPVGVLLKEAAIRKVTGFSLTGGMPMLALQLSSNTCPVRIREIADNQWVAVLR